MESNTQAGRAYSVANAVRTLYARAAAIKSPWAASASTSASALAAASASASASLSASATATGSAPSAPAPGSNLAAELHYPQPHLSLVPEPPAEPSEPVPAGKPQKRRSRLKPALLLLLLLLLALLVWALVQETRTSALQARFFASLAKKVSFQVAPGPSPSIRFPSDSPYDERLGYASLPDYLSKLRAQNYDITAQARLSPKMAELAGMGLFATYHEKTKVGLSIVDYRNAPLFSARFPERVYDGFAQAPSLLVQSLLFIENRELLDPTYPKRNPAIEWDRFSKAVFDKSLRALSGGDKRSAGGSTLATQIEKYRHSPDGRTGSLQDKLRQMVSATLRAYQGGEDTTVARRQIVIDYLNTVPLSAKLGYGEVNGIGDGMWVWYGRNFDALNEALKGPIDTLDAALAYKQALSLMIAQRRPAHYLGAGAADLEALTNTHLRVLAQAGVITPQLRDLASTLALHPAPGTGLAPPVANAFTTRKAANAVRTHLAGLLGNSRLYNVDRLDLAVATTLNGEAQNAVGAQLRGLRDAESAKAAGLTGKGMLGNGDPANVVYSFTLIERGANANFLRIQTDNYDQPLDINEGAKLDLGSTAKLRTLITYLDIVEQLHKRFESMTPAQLKGVVIDPKDRLSLWGVEYFLSSKPGAERGLMAMLEAAMERTYSGNPGEGFFTGGGLHHFGNFSKLDDSRMLSVRQALRNSTNLVFVRLMRDVVRYYMFQLPGSSATLLADADDPRRADYLARFADREGREFLARFYNKYKGKSALDAEKALLASFRSTSTRLASVHRTIVPQATLAQFTAFLNDNLGSANEVPPERIARMYEQYAPANMSLADRGYLSSLHPLELWVVGYLRTHPGAGWTEVAGASVKQRQEVYAWLFNTHRKHAQDKRIAGLLEVEAFLKIHAQWKKMGYPFDSLVPSYATTLGASADRPAALAEMMGIVVNGGLRKPVQRIDSLHFAKDTPYETLLKHAAPTGFEKVLSPEVARTTADAIRGVVSDGTAKRVKSAFVAADGSIIAVGGKTGTGDQRFDVYGAGGRLIESRFVNRSATFVFNIGERFFGSMTAYVHGPNAANYDFTSALPVQLLVVLAPTLMPMIDPEAAANAKAKASSAAAGAAALAAAKVEGADPAAALKPAINKPDAVKAVDTKAVDTKAAKLASPAGAPKPKADKATAPQSNDAGEKPKAASVKAKAVDTNGDSATERGKAADSKTDSKADSKSTNKATSKAAPVVTDKPARRDPAPRPQELF